MRYLKLKDIKGKIFKSPAQMYQPSVLDRCPEFAAEYLTLKHRSRNYEIFKELCEDIENEEPEKRYPVLYSLVTHSVENYSWFCNFFKALAKLNEKEEMDIPLIEDLAYFSSPTGITVYPPFTPKKVKRGYTPAFSQIKLFMSDRSIIHKHRVYYMRKKYSPTSFANGYPRWYQYDNMAIFEKYDPKTNVRVKITKQDGQFRFFLSGASDYWKELAGVPLEMDFFISALLDQWD